jgi:uncharacterized protein (DUF433 family)
MWVVGQDYEAAGRRRILRPIISPASSHPPALSFINMVEAHVLTVIRYQHGISFQGARRAVEYLNRELHSRHPLAEEQFETDGINLFVERIGVLLDVSAPGQLAMREILSALLRRIERDDRGLATRLYPFSRRPDPPALNDSPRLVVIDPRIGFGRPVLVGTGVTTSTIAERFDAGESIEELAADYDRPPVEIQEAIRCELKRDAA